MLIGSPAEVFSRGIYAEDATMNIGALTPVAASVQQIASNTRMSPDPPSVSAQSAPVANLPAAPGSVPVASLDQVNQAVQTINTSMQLTSRGLEFSVDADSNRTIVKVIDQQTKELIRQMPTQEALEIAKALDQGIAQLIRQKA